MTSGPGITRKTDSPDEAIEEISGLLEMDELKASAAAEGGTEQAHAVSEEVGDALDVTMETPSPVTLDSYLPPPPVSEEPAKQVPAAEGEAESGSNLAYEDLLEKLVLPAQPAPVEEPAAQQATPGLRAMPGSSPSESLFPTDATREPSQSESLFPFNATRASSPSESLFPSNITPCPVVPEERTVVTVNPLLAEEQEAAAREAENYILPAAPPPEPPLPDTPVVVTEIRPAAKPKFAVLPGKLVQTTYPLFGGILLGGIILGVLVGRASAPTKVIEKVSVVQAPPEAAPVAPIQAAQPANPNPSLGVVPLPTTAEAPKPAAQPAEAPKPAAQPAAAPEPPQAAAVPELAQPAAAKAEVEEQPAGKAKPEPKPKAHHASKASHPAKPAAKPVVAAKPVAAAKPAPAAKPAGGKKPAAKGWVDPFAN